MRATVNQARSFATRVLTTLGVPREHAALTARLLVRTDLRGVRTHGLKFLPVYARRLQGGGVNPCPRIRKISPTVFDGDAGLGQVCAMHTLTHARDVAAKRGLGLAICRNTSHVSALASYLLEYVPGRAVIAMTNTGPSVAPPGGNQRVIGNNCFGFATPIRGAAPLCLDMTTSVEAWGKVRDRIDRGESLPEGIALAPDGSWATDPAVALAHTVAAPLGGGKGFGLALMIDILAAGLSGGSLSPQLHMLHTELAKAEGTCCAFLVFDLKHFPGGRSLPHRLAQWRRDIKDVKRVPGVRQTWVSGEIEHNEEQYCRRHGFPIAPELRRELDDLAEQLGIKQRIASR